MNQISKGFLKHKKFPGFVSLGFGVFVWDMWEL